MKNIENLFDFSPGQFEAVDHLLTMGVGAHIAALVFFILMAKLVAPRYRPATALSCIVMVSAGLILFSQADMWTETFKFADGSYSRTNLTFSNGYRYVNWMVTIPCLLVQLFIVLGLSKSVLIKKATIAILAAWGMILTGYVGQLYEVSDIGNLLIWGAISTVFFIAMSYVVGMQIGKQKDTMPAPTNGTILKVFGLMMFAWTLYPIAYLIPWFMNSADGVVVRQLLFTIADVTSKIIYGLMITYIAIHRSAAEGYLPAIQALGLKEEGVKAV